MLKDKIYFSSVEVNNFHVLGTPQQIIEFAKIISHRKEKICI